MGNKPMLAAAALILFSPAAHARISPEHLEPKKVAELIRQLGYRFRASPLNDTSGTIPLDGATVSLGMGLGGSLEDQGPIPRVVGLSLSIEISVGEDVPLHEAERREDVFIATPNLRAIPHLGRTVTLLQDIDLEDGFDPDRVSDLFDRFLQDGNAYARRHRGRFVSASVRDWSKARFPNDLVLDRADRTSFERAAASWGLKRIGDFDAPNVFQALNYRIGNTTFSVTVNDPPYEIYNAAYQLTTILRLPAKVSPSEWNVATSKPVGWERSFVHKDGSVVAVERIDMTPGVTVNRLRSLIEGFPQRASAFQASFR